METAHGVLKYFHADSTAQFESERYLAVKTLF